MADAKPHEIIIVRRRGGGHGDAHHGGVWKIAFADFMTAMMAFFLVLWIVNSTSKETRASVARYFNPVQLAETTTARKGLETLDQLKTEDTAPGPEHGAGSSLQPPPEAAAKPTKFSGDAAPQGDDAAKTPAESAAPAAVRPSSRTLEESLLQNPDAVLAEIVASDPQPDPDRPVVRGESAVAEAMPPRPTAFRDPFATSAPLGFAKAPQANAPQARPQPQAQSQPQAQPSQSATPSAASSASQPARAEPGAAALTAPSAQAAPIKEDAVRSDDNAASGDAAVKAETAKLQGEIAAALQEHLGAVALPAIEVTATDEGLLISLTDKLDFAMFAVGSAVPQPRTIRVIDTLVPVLKKHDGLIVVRGHTDSRPYRTGGGDNWRLSSARAQVAFHMLIRAGVDEKRIDRIEGHAAQHLKNPKEPAAPENRRIEILIRRDKA